MAKLSVAIIFGGKSSEHDVSISSAATIANNISEKYEVHYLYITKKGQWYLLDNINPDKSTLKIPAVISPDALSKGIIVLEGKETKFIKLDVVIPVLHGKNGEDGSLQGLLQLSGIPIVGCDVTAASACMDKVITNALLMYFGIKKANFFWLYDYELKNDPEKCLNNIEEKIKNYPMFVKPAKAGSSVGITKVKNKEELLKGLEIAAKEDEKILVEEAIVGKEVECAILGNEKLTVSTVGEIIPSGDFYDYESKYISGTSGLCIPANIPEKIIEKIQKEASKAYKIMGCKGLSRIDFFVQDETQEIFLNEINTFPGFTEISMYPKLMEEKGIKIPELIDKLIELALENNQ
ncbi:MAG: D-alanine--D-alanine ligase family protein [Acutalibacteraceae bacterium]